MKKMLFIIFLLIQNISFSQTEKDDYEIYSEIINQQIENWSDKLETIILINKYENKFDSDLIDLKEYASDSLKDYQKQMIFSSVKPNSLALDLINKVNLRKLINNFMNDYKMSDNLDSKKLKIKKGKVIQISSNEYYSFFGKKFNKIEKGWKRIENMFDSNFVIQLSKIKYEKNIAVLYYSNHCGGLCGFGGLIVMKKIDNKWIEYGIIGLWMS